MTSSRARGGLTISTRAKNPQDNQSTQAPRATTSGTGAPAVVVVLVTHNPQETFETTLASLEAQDYACLLYTSPSPRDRTRSRMPSSA